MTGQGWNFADIWERIASRFPDESAQLYGDREYTWQQFEQRAEHVAASLLASDLARQDKVALYLYNCPEYLETVFAAFKASLVPVNTNYRYTDDELTYLWDNADVRAVVFDAEFTDRCERMRVRLPKISTWLYVSHDGDPDACPSWALPYETVATAAGASATPSWSRSPDDQVIIYTGGTTGLPKGVMWRQDDVVMSLSASWKEPLPIEADWAAFDRIVRRLGPRNLPAAPLMHGTGWLNAMSHLAMAGSVVTLPMRSFDPGLVCQTIQDRRVRTMSMVGDAMGKPIVKALDDDRRSYDISSLRVIISSGVMWSPECKQGLLRHNPELRLVDTLGSTEAIGMATHVTTSDSSSARPTETARFTLGPNTRVLTPDGREVTPGSSERGIVALRGRTPLGYYKDETRSAKTFVEFEGERWTLSGDWAEVAPGGELRLIGRGSQCINTGGEKVYPEEVEEALKRFPAIRDAAVVGLPDERFGERVVALVTAEAPDGGVDVAAAGAFVRQQLAGYKNPKVILAVETLGRGPNGKLDYGALKQLAQDQLASIS